MSAKIDDFDLIKKDAEEDKGLIHEMRSVSRISTRALRSLVEHRIAGTNGSVFTDTGRVALKVVVEGEIMGETAKQSIAMLRSKYEAGEPVPFTSDITTLLQIHKVVIEDVQIFQRPGELNHYHYGLLLREYQEPPSSDSEPPDQKKDAEDEADDDSDVRGVRGVVLGPDGKPKQGVDVNVKSDAGEWRLTTDENGKYRMHDPADGTYTITVSTKGYENKKRIVVIKKS
jgi:hypothetical protein